MSIIALAVSLMQNLYGRAIRVLRRRMVQIYGIHVSTWEFTNLEQRFIRVLLFWRYSQLCTAQLVLNNMSLALVTGHLSPLL